LQFAPTSWRGASRAGNVEGESCVRKRVSNIDSGKIPHIHFRALALKKKREARVFGLGRGANFRAGGRYRGPPRRGKGENVL